MTDPKTEWSDEERALHKHENGFLFSPEFGGRYVLSESDLRFLLRVGPEALGEPMQPVQLYSIGGSYGTTMAGVPTAATWYVGALTRSGEPQRLFTLAGARRQVALHGGEITLSSMSVDEYRKRIADWRAAWDRNGTRYDKAYADDAMAEFEASVKEAARGVK